MSDIHIRRDGHAGRITLTREHALNALTWDMVLAVERALDDWVNDPDITLLIIDAAGHKAFCAGGDIQELYDTGTAGDYSYCDRFWRDEYRMVAKLFNFPKPVVTFLQGFTMGGGVGLGCHGSHRVVCDGSTLSMPEVSIGLVPDVGGSLILARAPGRLGEYIGLTADRMDAADAIHAGFADYYIPHNVWPTLIETLCTAGNWDAIDAAATRPPPSRLAAWQADIDAVFSGEAIGDIWRGMPDPLPDAIAHARTLMLRNSPMAQHAALVILRKVRIVDTIEGALNYEFRATSRAVEHGDFLEGIRAAIIDRDRSPKWRFATWDTVSGGEIVRLGYPVNPPLDLTGDAP
ncbi:enoyl-CoA hydratase/isomerase family protein [Octadecabacter sp.]|nr:enoyl-CoA hydratase/isomerase family protein [Octadecabacter sp.]